MSKTIRLVMILVILAGIAAAVIFIPAVQTSARGAWNWAFGSPKVEVGFYYTCPMHPQVHLPHPGECPICGMTLVKKTESAEVITATNITLTDRQIQIGGIRTEPIQKRNLVKIIEAVGRVDYDERSLYHISARTDGRIDKLYVNFTGATINPHHALIWFYSPQLVSTQKEYLLAVDTYKTIKTSQFTETVKSAEELVRSAKQRLLLWGITGEQINELEKTRQVTDHLTIYSPGGGTVIKKNVVEGMYVKEGDTLFEIADLADVWLYADIYEPDIALVNQPFAGDYYQCPMHPEVKDDKPGNCPIAGCQMPLIRHSPALVAEVTTKSYPGEVFSGAVEFTYPFVNPETRTLRIRITIPNPELKLRPEMYARVQIKITRDGLLGVPESAVIYTGKRDFVFISEGEGKLSPRHVVLGGQWLYDDKNTPSEEKALPFHRGMQRYHEVREGLKEGEVVVTTGNFLVDAESQIQGAMERFLAEPGQTAGPGGEKEMPMGMPMPPGHKH